MILQTQCTRVHVHWVLLIKVMLNIDYFSIIWYNITMDI